MTCIPRRVQARSRNREHENSANPRKVVRVCVRCLALSSGSQYAQRRFAMNSLVREPAVAGQFYPGRPDRLLREVQEYTAYAGPKVRAIGCVAPHAGYMYSGHVAGAVYARLELP